MRRRPVPEKIPVLIDVVHPEPRCEMWFGVVKQIIHLVTHPRRHILELGMVQTVFSGVFYQRRRFGNVDTSVFVLPEQCHEARQRHDCMYQLKVYKKPRNFSVR